MHESTPIEKFNEFVIKMENEITRINNLREEDEDKQLDRWYR